MTDQERQIEEKLERTYKIEVSQDLQGMTGETLHSYSLPGSVGFLMSWLDIIDDSNNNRIME